MKSVCFSFNKKRFKYAVITGFFLFLIISGVAVNNRMNKAVSNLNVAFEKTIEIGAITNKKTARE